MNKKGNIVEFSEQEKKKFNDYILKFAQKGLRTLAICMKLDAGALATYDKKHDHPGHTLLQQTENFD